MLKGMLQRMQDGENKVVKSSIWYMVCSFITNAISFVTAPVFARILTKQVYGEYSNFASWYNIISCFTTLNLYATIWRAKYDFKEEFTSYISSILALGSLNTLICYFFVFIFRIPFSHIFNLEMPYINIMFISLLFQPASIIFQTIQRIEYRYKLSVVLTIFTSVMTAVGGIALVFTMENKFLGRVVGGYGPAFIINGLLFVYMIKRNPHIKISHWKYAYFLCLPYVPHLLAGNLLSALDRVMITNICGAEANAIYSLAGNGALIMSIFSISVSNAIQPWIYERIHKNEKQQIRKAISILFCLYTVLSIYLAVFAKEIVFILGGSKYYAAAKVLPALLLGGLFQFMYTFYVGVEQFEKKTVGMAIATVVAAGVNYALNALLIPVYGYEAAGYTTAASYCILLLMHFFLVKHLGHSELFDTRLLFVLPITFIGIVIFILGLNDIGRYIVAISLTSILLIVYVRLANKRKM